MKGVILTARPINPEMSPIFGNIPASLVPVNGKPIAFHIIDRFIEFGITDVYIAIDHNPDFLIQLIDSFYTKKINIHYLSVNKTFSAGRALIDVFHQIDGGPVLVNLGDTICDVTRDISWGEDIIYVDSMQDISERWCLVDAVESKVIGFKDKQTNQETSNIAVGMYLFSDIETLAESLDGTSELEISDIYTYIMNTQDVKTEKVDKWYDFGHLDQYQIARKELLCARFFNTLEFDNLLGCVTKKSENIEKFINEIRWQQHLPSDISVLFPRILDANIYTDKPYIKMEFYSYQSLAEIWLYSSYKASTFRPIITKVLEVLDIFKKYPLPVHKSSYHEVYIEKTKARLDSLIEVDGAFAELITKETVIVNGQSLKGWNTIKESIYDKIQSLYDENDNYLIHGDFCFSNILYDTSSGLVRLLDPRGAWGSSIGGDIKYDIAKLRHSISGKYDFIVNDLFNIDIFNNTITYEVYSQDHHEEIAKHFDNLIADKHDLKKIQLIEGILFLSMIPLHADSKSRQLYMYAKSLELLNECI